MRTVPDERCTEQFGTLKCRKVEDGIELKGVQDARNFCEFMGE